MTIDVRTAPKRKSRKPLLAGFAVIVLALAVFAAYKFWPSDSEKGEAAKLDTIAVLEDTTGEGPDISEIPVVPATGIISINVTPLGDIYVDDSLLGKRTKSASLTCDTGIHIIRVENEKATRKVRHDTVSLAADQVLPLTYRFTIPRPPVNTAEPKPLFREVVIGSNPRGAKVFIDGELQRQKTPYTFKFTLGEHVVKVVKLTQEGEEVEQDSTILVGEEGPEKVIFDFEK